MRETYRVLGKTMNEVGENLKIRDKTAGVVDSKELTALAAENAQKFGSTVEGFLNFTDEMSKRIEKSADPSDNPNFTRACVQLYNKGLKLAGINDEMVLHYHFTSIESSEEIVRSGSIQAVGKTPFMQVREAYEHGGTPAALKQLLHFDNIERIAVHVASQTPPEKVEGNRGAVNVLKNTLIRVFAKPNSIGIPSEKLQCYFEIVSAKSDMLFKSTHQSKTPLIRIDELYLDPKIGQLELDMSNQRNYVVFGPKKNVFLR